MNNLYNRIMNSIRKSLNENFDLDDFDLDDNDTNNDIILKKSKISSKEKNKYESEFYKKSVSVAKIFPLYFTDESLKKFKGSKLHSTKDDDIVYFGGLDEYRLETNRWGADYKRAKSDINLLLNAGKIKKLFHFEEAILNNADIKEMHNGNLYATYIMHYMISYECEEFNESHFIKCTNELLAYQNSPSIEIILAVDRYALDKYRNKTINDLSDEQIIAYKQKLAWLKDLYNTLMENERLVEYIKTDFHKAAELYIDRHNLGTQRIFAISELYITPDDGMVIVVVKTDIHYSNYSIFTYLTGNIDYNILIANNKQKLKANTIAKKSTGINAPEFADFKALLKQYHIADTSAKYYTKYTEVVGSIEGSDTPRKVMCVFINTPSSEPGQSIYRYFYSFYQKLRYLSKYGVRNTPALKPITNSDLLLEDNTGRGSWNYIIGDGLLVRKFFTKYTLNDCPLEDLKAKLETQEHAKDGNGLIAVIVIEDIRGFYDLLMQKQTK